MFLSIKVRSKKKKIITYIYIQNLKTQLITDSIYLYPDDLDLTFFNPYPTVLVLVLVLIHLGLSL